MPGDSEKPRKRDIFFNLFKSKRPSSAKKTKLQPSGADDSQTATYPAITVGLRGAMSGLNETIIPSTSTRALTASRQPLAATPSATEPPIESQPKDTPRDAILRPVPESQSGTSAATAMTEDTTHSQIGKDAEQPTTAATSNNQATPSLWNRAIESLGDELSSLRKALAEKGIKFESDTVGVAAAVGTITEGVVQDKKGKDWKINFRGEKLVLRDIGMKVLEWVHRFKEIGDIIVQFDPVHAALPWAGFRFLLQVCLDKQETLDAILIGLEKTAGLIDRCTAYEILYLNGESATSKRLEKSILQLYTAILRFLAEAVKRSKDNNITAVFAAGEIPKYLDEVERLEKTVGQDAAAAGAQSTRTGFERLQRLLEDTNMTISHLGSQIDNIQQTLEGSRKSEILEWISKIPYTNHHKRINGGRLNGTGDWLFERTEYRAWRSSSASKLLLLQGIPGAGKTYIASKVIDSFLLNPTTTKLAYFYCNRAEENRRNPESILNALVHQLAQAAQTESENNLNKLLKPVVDIYQDRENKGQKSSPLVLAESEKLLIQLTDLFPKTTICVDALDEVENETRVSLLKSLKNVIEGSKNLVKIFATTRMDTDILLQFEMFPLLVLQPDDNVGDINQFVGMKVQSAIADRLLLHGEVSPGLEDEIRRVLRARSKGMFQLAALQITFLCEMATEDDVRDSLKTLPDSLTTAYEEIYTRILGQKGSAPRMALNAFRWIQNSYEPMRSETLLDALSIEVGDSGDCIRKATIKANDLLRVCQNLVILDKSLNVFRFAHLSVDEYLETKLPKVESHTELTKICLSLLCTPNSWGADGYDTTLQTKKDGYNNRHLLLYSAVFWPWHFSRCEDVQRCQILTDLWAKFVSETHYNRWLQYQRTKVQTNYWPNEDIFWFRVKAFGERGEDQNLLSMVCLFGLSQMFTAIFESTPHVEKAGLDQLLFQACGFGDLDITQLLIDKGADVSAADRDEWTPLHLASDSGHEELARMLIDRGADVSAVNNLRNTALHLASRGGHEAVARMLIDRGADVSAADKRRRTPLYLASDGGHEAVARLLIDRGADVSAADWSGSTPLHLASQKEHEAVARLLIDRGADVSAVDKGMQTPLHIASQSGYEAVARMLIDRGADISVADKWSRTPLHLALERRHKAVARMLIDRGADVSAANKDGSTPLDVVGRRNRAAIIALLGGQVTTGDELTEA